MDWTGGLRRRFASKGQHSELVQKQRAHFARLRNTGIKQPLHYIPNFVRDAVTHQQFQPSNNEVTGPKEGAQTRNDRKRTQSQQRNGYTIAKSARHKEEAVQEIPQRDRALSAARRRLLAREDWLGLQASNPKAYRFPSPPTERIGKRHKVIKQKPRDACSGNHRRVPRPFQHRQHAPVRSVSSDVARGGEFDIKVGTDAFASQIQRVQAVESLDNVSARHVSTEFSYISEETMLLGMEGDNFEVPADGHSFDILHETTTNVRPTSGVRLMYRSPESPGIKRAEWSRAHIGMARDRVSTSPPRSPNIYFTPEKASGTSPRCMANLYGPIGERPYSIDNSDRDAVQPHLKCTPPVLFGENDEFRSTDVLEISSFKEEKKLKDLEMMKPSRASAELSLAALISSSSHFTHSTIDSWRNGVGRSETSQPENIDDLNSLLPLHNGAIYVPSLLHLQPKQHQITAHNSAQHEQPIQPEIRTTYKDVQYDDTQDNAAWLHFILGSQSSDSKVPDHPGRKMNAEQLKPVSYAPGSIFSQNTEVIRSDRATIGVSQWPDAAPALYKHHPQFESSNALDNTSMMGHAATTHLMSDEMDEQLSKPVNHRAGTNKNMLAVGNRGTSRSKHAISKISRN